MGVLSEVMIFKHESNRIKVICECLVHHQKNIQRCESNNVAHKIFINCEKEKTTDVGQKFQLAIDIIKEMIGIVDMTISFEKTNQTLISAGLPQQMLDFYNVNRIIEFLILRR